MSFHWTKIISLNSSQNDAFEELVCQLANKESIENKKKYISPTSTPKPPKTLKIDNF